MTQRMIERAFHAPVPFAWCTGDEAYGQVKSLPVWPEGRDVSYVLTTRRNDDVVIPDPAQRPGRRADRRERHVLGIDRACVPQNEVEQRVIVLAAQRRGEGTLVDPGTPLRPAPASGRPAHRAEPSRAGVASSWRPVSAVSCRPLWSL